MDFLSNSNDMPLLPPILLAILGLILVLLEVTLPSAGILGVLAVISLIGSVILAFKINNMIGLCVAGGLIISLPIVIVLGLKIFPHTPLGKRMTLAPSIETEEQRGLSEIAEEDFDQLNGQYGITLTQLRPSGIAEIRGKRYSVVARGQIIEAGKQVQVTDVEGNSIIVDEINTKQS